MVDKMDKDILTPAIGNLLQDFIVSLAQMVESIGYERVDILGDFPVDMFLTVPETDYYAGTFGKTAHKIRVETSNLISEDIVRYIKYCRASIEIGLGRSIHAIYKMA